MKLFTTGCLLFQIILFNIISAQPIIMPTFKQYPPFPNTFLSGPRTLTKKQIRIAKALSTPGNLADYEAGQQFQFNVFYKNNTQKIVKGSIVTDTITGKSVLQFTVGKSKEVEKVSPSETYAIVRMYNDAEVICTGVPNENCWYFKIIEGKINAYSTYADQEFKNELPIAAIDAENLPITSYSIPLLRSLLIKDPKTHTYFNNGKYQDAIKQYNWDNRPKDKSGN